GGRHAHSSVRSYPERDGSPVVGPHRVVQGSSMKFFLFVPSTERIRSATILTVALSLVTIHLARADGFIELASTNSPRFLPTATLLANGHVLLAGGGGEPIFEDVASAETYDPTAHSWNPVGFMHTPRLAHRAVRLPNGKVLVAGG